MEYQVVVITICLFLVPLIILLMIILDGEHDVRKGLGDSCFSFQNSQDGLSRQNSYIAGLFSKMTGLFETSLFFLLFGLLFLVIVTPIYLQHYKFQKTTCRITSMDPHEHCVTKCADTQRRTRRALYGGCPTVPVCQNVSYPKVSYTAPGGTYCADQQLKTFEKVEKKVCYKSNYWLELDRNRTVGSVFPCRVHPTKCGKPAHDTAKPFSRCQVCYANKSTCEIMLGISFGCLIASFCLLCVPLGIFCWYRNVTGRHNEGKEGIVIEIMERKGKLRIGMYSCEDQTWFTKMVNEYLYGG